MDMIIIIIISKQAIPSSFLSHTARKAGIPTGTEEVGNNAHEQLSSLQFSIYLFADGWSASRAIDGGTERLE
jgi:hypothetical protein